MLEVILISGKAGNGKTTFGNFLQKELESKGKRCVRVSFGDQVKFYATKYFNWDGEKNKEGRALLQWLGTEKFREADPDYWVRLVYDFLSVVAEDYDFAIIDDWRFINESSYFSFGQFKYDTVKIIRVNYSSPLTAEQLSHRSETELDEHMTDYVVINDSFNSLLVAADRLSYMLSKERSDVPFEEVYDGSLDGEEKEVLEDEILKTENSKPCFVCKHRVTSWVSTSFMAHVCSEQCLGTLWDRYMFAVLETVRNQ